ncbi:hypothetical protein EYC84_005693 [Monilinia fructicola]|uniref:Uncharacterized protein n=1 Tax=Monilinia fructicola TaxID=38448 RepID=A0A5M9K173_MONFR|nr:hypothetical protein EYC84_005693 [Monilinia fructicola]
MEIVIIYTAPPPPPPSHSQSSHNHNHIHIHIHIFTLTPIHPSIHHHLAMCQTSPKTKLLVTGQDSARIPAQSKNRNSNSFARNLGVWPWRPHQSLLPLEPVLSAQAPGSTCWTIQGFLIRTAAGVYKSGCEKRKSGSNSPRSCLSQAWGPIPHAVGPSSTAVCTCTVRSRRFAVVVAVAVAVTTSIPLHRCLGVGALRLDQILEKLH